MVMLEDARAPLSRGARAPFASATGSLLSSCISSLSVTTSVVLCRKKDGASSQYSQVWNTCIPHFFSFSGSKAPHQAVRRRQGSAVSPLPVQVQSTSVVVPPVIDRWHADGHVSERLLPARNRRKLSSSDTARLLGNEPDRSTGSLQSYQLNQMIFQGRFYSAAKSIGHSLVHGGRTMYALSVANCCHVATHQSRNKTLE